MDIDKQISELFELTKKDTISEDFNITPIEIIEKEKIPIEEKTNLEEIGSKILKNNQFAIITLAGGQGTRLGFNGPKGAYKLNIGKNGKYIFEILADTLKKAEKEYGVLPYWYIMTSSNNNSQTIKFFEEQNYFNLNKEKVHFFTQEDIPILTLDGKKIIEDGKIKVASNGNGGIYKALKTEKIIENMKENGVKWVYICGVDNILAKPIDPLLMGLTIKNNMKAASKTVLKAYPEENVGVYCRKNGKPCNIEYMELPEKIKNELDNEGNPKYGDANIVSYLFSIDILEELSNCNLKYHVNIKKGAYKFEKFIFDALEFLDDIILLRVKREEEFAPIKNKQGIDSPETAIKEYEKSCKNI